MLECDNFVKIIQNTLLPFYPTRLSFLFIAGLELGPFVVKVNHRKLLDGLFEVCGVPKKDFRPICSAVDKLDKSPWTEVRQEMVDEKGK